MVSLEAETHDGRGARRQRIFDAAVRHFSERPYDEVSTVAIAEEAGVNRGWIHHEFGSKHDLYVEVLREVCRVPFVPRLPEPGAKDDLNRLLDSAIETWLDEVEEHPQAYLAGQRISGGLVGEAKIQQLIDEFREDSIDGVLRVMFPDADRSTPWLRAVVSGLGAAVGDALVEWLERGRLTRSQVKVLMVQSTLNLWSLASSVERA